jgi:hypothetical protein
MIYAVRIGVGSACIGRCIGSEEWLSGPSPRSSHPSLACRRDSTLVQDN